MLAQFPYIQTKYFRLVSCLNVVSLALARVASNHAIVVTMYSHDRTTIRCVRTKLVSHRHLGNGTEINRCEWKLCFYGQGIDEEPKGRVAHEQWRHLCTWPPSHDTINKREFVPAHLLGVAEYKRHTPNIVLTCFHTTTSFYRKARRVFLSILCIEIGRGCWAK